jgi:hypothetical protein
MGLQKCNATRAVQSDVTRSPRTQVQEAACWSLPAFRAVWLLSQYKH